MTRAFPAYSVEQREFILLQEAASYLLLACGAVYVVSVSLVNNTLFPNLILRLGKDVLYVSALCLLRDLCSSGNSEGKAIFIMVEWRFTYFPFFGMFHIFCGWANSKRTQLLHSCFT